MAKKRHLKEELRSVQSGNRKEVEAAVDILVKEVAQLALRIKHAVAASDTAKAELARRAVDALRMRGVVETNDPLELQATAPSPSEPQVVEIADVAMFPLSPKQGCAAKAGLESNSKTCQSQNEAMSTSTNVANGPQENTVAARVAELSERLGGFITPSPSISGRKR